MTLTLKKIPKIERHIHFEGSLFSLIERGEKVNSFYDFLNIFKKVCFKIKGEGDFLYLSDEFFSYILGENIIFVEFFLSIPVWMKRGFNLFKILENINYSGEKYSKNLKFKIIVDGVRQFHTAYMYKLIDYFEELKKLNVSGFGIGGDEECCGLQRFYLFFELAKKSGFLINIHSGEVGGLGGAFNDVFLVRPDRVGHFLCLNKLNFKNFFLKDEIIVDYSLSSNLLTKSVESIKDHPLFELKDRVNFLINSDDPAIFNTTLTKEYEIFLENGGSIDDIKKMFKREVNSLPFYKREEKEKLMSIFL